MSEQLSTQSGQKSPVKHIHIKLAAQAAMVVLAMSQFAVATTYTWDGGDGSSQLTSTPTNWSTDIAPAATGDNLVFDGTVNLNVSNDFITSLGSTSITFAAGAGSFNIGGNTIILGNAAANDNIITKVSTNNQTISANLTLAAGGRDRTIIMTGGGTLSLTGNVNFANDWLFPTTTAGTLVLSGTNIGDGKGSVLVSGTNSSRAMMRNNVAGTTLVLGSDTALGNSGSGDVGLGTANFRGLAANQNLTINTTGGNRNLGGSSIIINAGNVSYSSTDSLIIGNLINQAGNRDFWVTNSGQVTVGNGISLSNDQTGRNLYVNLTGTGGIVVNGKLYDTFHSGGITTGISTLRKAGTGSMTLNGDSSNYVGLITVEAGTLKIGHANALGAVGATSGTTLTGNATLDINGQTIGETITINNNGNSIINSNTTAAVVSADVALNAPITLNATGDMTFTRLIGNNIRIVTKLGSGTVTTNGNNHNNLTAWDIQAGTVIFANTAGLASDRGTTLNGGTLKLSGANSNLINEGQEFTINSGTFDLNGKGEAVASIGGSGGIVTNSNTAAATLFVGGGNSGTSTASYGGVVQNGVGVINVTKEGTGTQTFTGANTYSGATTVNGGKLVTTVAITNGNTLSINNGATHEIPTNGTASGVTSISALTTTGTGSHIELHDNDLVLNYSTNPSTYTDVVNKVKSGLTLLGGTGTEGITSVEVDAQTVGGTVLAVVDDGDPNIGGGITTISGYTIPNPATSVLVKYTWFGDANLDGMVDGSDYALTDTGFTSGGLLGGWVFGDYDYSGIVDGGDYALQDTGFIAQTGSLPEPATLGLLCLGAVGMLRRRRAALIA